MLTKEQSRDQFNAPTKQYNVQHSFSFDEVYDCLMDARLAKQRKADFRRDIMKLECNMLKHPLTVSALTTPDAYPLKHTFADGMYIRELTVPAGVLTITKIHAQTHPFFVLKGCMTILTEKGKQRINAPYSGITQAGTKRVIMHHTEVVITTVHRTNEMDLDKIEGDIVASDFNSLDDRIAREKYQKYMDILVKEEEED